MRDDGTRKIGHSRDHGDAVRNDEWEGWLGIGGMGWEEEGGGRTCHSQSGARRELHAVAAVMRCWRPEQCTHGLNRARRRTECSTAADNNSTGKIGSRKGMSDPTMSPFTEKTHSIFKRSATTTSPYKWPRAHSSCFNRHVARPDSNTRDSS